MGGDLIPLSNPVSMDAFFPSMLVYRPWQTWVQMTKTLSNKTTISVQGK